MKNFIRTKPLFLFLLPLFFVLHGFTGNYDFVPVGDALLLTLIYSGSALLIATTFRLLYRDFTKASLVAFLIMAYHFFFGSVQDLLRKYFAGIFISRYSFILPVSFLFFLTVIIWLKKRKKLFTKLTSYLNLLLLLLITIDAGWLAGKMLKPEERASSERGDTGFIKCDTCKKPDIFFIILDEYSGNTALKERFNFDNAAFENKLHDRGFYVAGNSRSNYNFTPFSVASILNMDYLDLNMKTKGQGNLNYCYRMIRNGRIINFFKANGYQLYNYSIFDFSGQPARNYDNFLPTKTKLITAQTFLSRLGEDIRFNIVTGKFGFKAAEKKIIYSHLHNNESFLKLTRDIAARQSLSPKFVYTHLMMPHDPFYFDSKGTPLPLEKLREAGKKEKNDYVEYLQYCNKKILQLADDILGSSPTPPVIILLGDHGFKYFQQKEERRYSFLNLDAVYMPTGNYNRFYDSISNVNLFRVILNTQFHQHLPMLKDSTIYLWELP